MPTEGVGECIVLKVEHYLEIIQNIIGLRLLKCGCGEVKIWYTIHTKDHAEDHLVERERRLVAAPDVIAANRRVIISSGQPSVCVIGQRGSKQGLHQNEKKAVASRDQNIIFSYYRNTRNSLLPTIPGLWNAWAPRQVHENTDHGHAQTKDQCPALSHSLRLGAC